MRVEKFSDDDIATLRSAGFKIDDDNEVAKANCEVTIICPSGGSAGGRLLLQL